MAEVKPLRKANEDLKNQIEKLMKDFNKLGEQLSSSNSKTNAECIEAALDNLESYSYQYNVKIIGVHEESSNEMSKQTYICVKLFNAMGVEISLSDIDIAHRVPVQNSRRSNEPKPIICKFVRCLAKESVMRAKSQTRNLTSADLGFSLLSKTTAHRIMLFDHLTPKQHLMSIVGQKTV
ncbi:Hypothetical predicted protein [Paramuricea clavata]|uniref:Uncharacterized protein n=1 Tax=Paramuricea clavata TaxID=317549 RepID=A0A7D9H8Z8_PARCT|nr:Hypothetical predicted protein [Paramuricea clavata]